MKISSILGVRITHMKLENKFGDSENNKGITLLLVVVILSALLSTSFGIFNVLYGEILISGEVKDTLNALYAADEGIEKVLYLDRQSPSLCAGSEGPNCVTFTKPDTGNGCYTATVGKGPGACGAGLNTCAVSIGTSQCVAPRRIIKRSFQISY